MSVLATVGAALVSAGVAWLADAGIRYYSEHLKREANMASAACRALRRHREAVDQILSAPDLHPVLESFLLKFSEAVLSRAVAQRLAEKLKSGELGRADDSNDGSKFDELIMELQRKHPQCVELLAVAVGSG